MCPSVCASDRQASRMSVSRWLAVSVVQSQFVFGSTRSQERIRATLPQHPKSFITQWGLLPTAKRTKIRGTAIPHVLSRNMRGEVRLDRKIERLGESFEGGGSGERTRSLNRSSSKPMRRNQTFRIDSRRFRIRYRGTGFGEEGRRGT